MISSTSSARAPGERLGGGVAREQGGRHHVDPLVRALRGEDGRHHELVRVLVVERAGRFRMRLLQDVQDLVGALGEERATRWPRVDPSPRAFQPGRARLGDTGNSRDCGRGRWQARQAARRARARRPRAPGSTRPESATTARAVSSSRTSGSSVSVRRTGPSRRRTSTVTAPAAEAERPQAPAGARGQAVQDRFQSASRSVRRSRSTASSWIADGGAVSATGSSPCSARRLLEPLARPACPRPAPARRARSASPTSPSVCEARLLERGLDVGRQVGEEMDSGWRARNEAS